MEESKVRGREGEILWSEVTSKCAFGKCEVSLTEEGLVPLCVCVCECVNVCVYLASVAVCVGSER